eukprot:2937448-Prymnesium_polylepis.2
MHRVADRDARRAARRSGRLPRRGVQGARGGPVRHLSLLGVARRGEHGGERARGGGMDDRPLDRVPVEARGDEVDLRGREALGDVVEARHGPAELLRTARTART